jgi:hypothetical protein
MYYTRGCVEPCGGACCDTGQVVETSLVEDILKEEAEIEPFLRPEARKSKWFNVSRGFTLDEHLPHRPLSVTTAVLPDDGHESGFSCAFLGPEGRCALHEYTGDWRLKPLACWLWPLMVVNGVVRLAKVEFLDSYMQIVGKCMLRSGTPTVGVRLFEPELRHLLGEAGFNELVETFRL